MVTFAKCALVLVIAVFALAIYAAATRLPFPYWFSAVSALVLGIAVQIYALVMLSRHS